jgi:hypothetical protein
MSEETAVAAPSAADVTIELPPSGTPEYAEWRLHGTIPDKTPPADSSTADPAKEPTADAGAPPAQKQQERTGKPKTEKRFQDILSERNQLRAELDALKAKPATEQPKPVQQPQVGDREPTVEDKNPDGTHKFKTYEEFVKAQARYEIRLELAAERQREQQQAQLKAVEAKVNEAKSRYENFDEVSRPFVKAFVDDQQIPMALKVMVSESEVWPDLVFTIASDAEARESFVQMAKTNPGKAIRYIAKVESLIQEELAKETTVARDANGQFSKPEPKIPAKRGPESAPPPPIEIGNRGAGPMDESQRAISALEKGDNRAFREYMRAENAKEIRARRGA